MTKSEKILDKMRTNQQNWRIQEIENIVKNFGVSVRKSGGSHVVLTHPQWIDLFCIPAHRPIKAIYIKKLLALLDTLGEKK